MTIFTASITFTVCGAQCTEFLRLFNNILNHGLRTPNEGIDQRYLKNWADVADKICFGRT